MTNRQLPPGLKSIAWVVMVKPFGPHQCARCFGSVHSLNTSARGASKTRVTTISRAELSMAAATLLLAATLVLLFFGIFLLQPAQIILEAIEALLPEPSVAVEPLGRVLERCGRESARPPLRFAAALDQTGALQNFQVL